jgi:hypothetical protein
MYVCVDGLLWLSLLLLHMQMAIFTTWITCPTLALLFRGRGHELRGEDLPQTAAVAAAALASQPGSPTMQHTPSLRKVPGDMMTHTAASKDITVSVSPDTAAAAAAADGGVTTPNGGGMSARVVSPEPLSPRVRRSSGSITLLYSKPDWHC